MAMCPMLYGTFNHVTLDAGMAPYASGGRDLLLLHLDRVKAGDMLLPDRGYPCFWLLFLLHAKGIGFCVRLKDGWWKEVTDFLSQDLKEKQVTFILPKKDRERLSEYPSVWEKPLNCRLIKVELENGETEILCTSLPDLEKYDAGEFRKLYRYRWNGEEAYKLLRSGAELEKFSGKTARAVRQDFRAKVFLMAMCAVYAHPIEEKVIKEYKAGQNRKHGQKINRTHALATFMDMPVPMFLKKKYGQAIEAFDGTVYQTGEIIRPNRSVKRNKRSKKPYSMNFKPL